MAPSQTAQSALAFSNRPAGAGDISALRDLRAIDDSDRHIATGMLPENIALAVAVEVPVATIWGPTRTLCPVSKPIPAQR
jgi:hypothetical protein